MALLLGYDIGSSSIKATLMDAGTGKVLASATSPKKEMEIIARKAGWAEQHPQTWWQHVKAATRQIKAAVRFNPADVKAIGISYQMHGLVAVDPGSPDAQPDDHSPRNLGRGAQCLCAPAARGHAPTQSGSPGRSLLSL